MGDYKVIRKKKAAIEPYDLKSDLGEQHDIAEQYPEVIARVTASRDSARTKNPNRPDTADVPPEKAAVPALCRS